MRWYHKVAIVTAALFLALYFGDREMRKARVDEIVAESAKIQAAAALRTAAAQEGLTGVHSTVALGSLHASWPSAPIQFAFDCPKDPKLTPDEMGDRFEKELFAYLQRFPYRRNQE